MGGEEADDGDDGDEGAGDNQSEKIIWRVAFDGEEVANVGIGGRATLVHPTTQTNSLNQLYVFHVHVLD